MQLLSSVEVPHDISKIFTTKKKFVLLFVANLVDLEHLQNLKSPKGM